MSTAALGVGGETAEFPWTFVGKPQPAEERISYQMPTFALTGKDLVYSGAFKKHIGFYPPVRAENLRGETSIYEGAKGNSRFPLDKPIPYTLISKIMKARMRENQEAVATKRKKR